MLYKHKNNPTFLTKIIFDINYSVVIIEGVIINYIKHLTRTYTVNFKANAMKIFVVQRKM